MNKLTKPCNIYAALQDTNPNALGYEALSAPADSLDDPAWVVNARKKQPPVTVLGFFSSTQSTHSLLNPLRKPNEPPIQT